MPTPQDVLISGDRHLIVLGQFGNLKAKISQLEHKMRAPEIPELLPYLAEVEEELDYLIRIYPSLNGDVVPVEFQQRNMPPPYQRTRTLRDSESSKTPKWFTRYEGAG